MSGESPSSVLYSSDGTELTVVSGSLIPAGTRAVLISGIDPLGNARYIPSAGEGALGTAEMSNDFVVQSAAVVTASGSQLVTANFFGTQEIAIIVNVGTVTGAGSIVYTIQEVDPGDATTVFGNSASTATINSGNTPGVFTAVLNVTTSPMIKVSWVVTGAFSATIYSTVVTKSTPSTQAVTGSFTNPSVAVVPGTPPADATYVGALVNTTAPSGYTNGNMYPFSLTTNGLLRIDGVAPTGAAGPTDAMYVAGAVTTAAPTYITGQMDPLSLTTLGGLRIDGVYATGTATATAANAAVSGGYVTTAAPTYTTGQLNALSLTTAGLLRVDGTGGVFNNQSVGTDAAAALGFDTQVGGKVTTAAPTYTTGNLDVLSLTTSGGLRIDSAYPTGTTTANAPDMAQVGGIVTTAAPTYTTGQINALSLDTTGNLRVTGFVTTNKAATSTLTNVASSASSTTLLAANTNRIFAAIYNDSTKKVFVTLNASAASVTNFTILLLPNSYWEVPNDYTGQITGIWAAANGFARVTELTP